VTRLEVVRELEDDREHLRAVRNLQLPHERVDLLGEAGLLAQALVVRRLPGLADHRLALEAIDENAALVVDREVHRADHAIAAVGRQPARRGVEQRRQDLGVVLELEEAEHAPAVAVEAVEGVVVLGGDPAHHAAVAQGQEQLRGAVLEVGVPPLGEKGVALQA
jgi:hypothetical protein